MQLNNLLTKFLITMGGVLIYKLGCFLPVPLVNYQLASQGGVSSPILDFFLAFSGSSYDNASIFALALGPYVQASLITQILFSEIKELEQMKEREGNEVVNRYTKYLTVIIAFLQSLLFTNAIYNFSKGDALLNIVPELSLDSGWSLLFFGISNAITLIGGTCFLLWLGELITEYGIGNGASIIIGSGILSNLPNELKLITSNHWQIMSGYIVESQ